MSKPKFDPNKPYQDVVEPQAIKPKFDPNKPYQDVADPVQEPAFSKKESAMWGSIQGIPAVGPWADEAEGAVRSVFSDKTYEQERDIARQRYKDAEAANPKSYMTGVMAPTLAMAPIKSIPVLGTGLSAVLGAVEGAGASEAEDVAGMAKDAAISSGVSAATAGIGNRLIPAVTKKISNVGEGMINKSKKLVLNATGATGKQVSEFSADAADQLIDRGLIKFGDSQETIAKRVALAKNKAGNVINSSLQELEEQGLKVEKSEVAKRLREKIRELKGNEAKSDVRAKMLSIVYDIERSGRKAKPTILQAEGIKRDFGSNLKKAWADPVKAEADKAAYLAYRDEVEKVALKHNPELFEKFKAEKDTFGLLAPIEEAAAKRANVTQQSPPGGLLDTAAFGTGALMGGGDSEGISDNALAGAAWVAGRRMLAPRLASSSAVTLNKLGKAVKKTPQVFGKFAPILLQASQRGGNSLKEADAILREISPEYMETLDNINKEK